MRRVLALLAVSALLLAWPGGAAANAPIREVDRSRDAGCGLLETPLGFAEFSGYSSETYGADAWLDVWEGEPYASDLVLTRDWEQTPTVVFTGDTVSMSIPVVPSGTVTVTGTLTPADTIAFDDRFRDGNSWFRSSATGTAFAFTGTLTLPGVNDPIAFGPEGCGGGDVLQTTFITQPNARVSSFTSSGGTCELANADGDTGFVFVGADEGFVFLDGSVVDSSGTQVGFFGGGSMEADGSAVLTLEEFDPETGEPLGTTASATVSLVDTGEAFSYTLRTSSGFQRTRGSVLDVEGDLAMSLGTFSLDACVAADSQSKIVEASSNGPKTGGKRPANDLPGGAITLKAGSRATVATRGAQQPSEAGYPCLTITDPFDGATYDIPVEHTVWYTVQGTGGTITVDTAGSDFDTVVAVYAGSPDAANIVACVDDVPLAPVGRTLQAAATFATTAGTTYWIQIGGLNEEAVFGPDPFVPYGNLKVVVR